MVTKRPDRVIITVFLVTNILAIGFIFNGSFGDPKFISIFNNKTESGMLVF